MQDDELAQVFRDLKIESSKLGGEDSEPNQATTFSTDRNRIERLIARSARDRAKRLAQLSLYHHVLLGAVIIATVFQIAINFSVVVTVVQVICAAIVFPLSRQIERQATSQAFVEFVAAFLPEMEPSEAIKEINRLYAALEQPANVREAAKAHAG